MPKILDKDNKTVIVKFTVSEFREYNKIIDTCFVTNKSNSTEDEQIDYNLYELPKNEITSELIKKLNKASKTPKKLLVNI
jgi:hypothetical protein